jgi:hypothetical protein
LSSIRLTGLTGSAACPQGKKKKKAVKRQKPQVPIFAPYWSRSLQMLSLSPFIESIYASQDI